MSLSMPYTYTCNIFITTIRGGYTMANNRLSNLIGKFVRVNRGGPESSDGVLVAVKHDYIVLFIKKDGFIFYNLEHIKSITLLNHHGRHDFHSLNHRTPRTFIEALRANKHRLIKVNRGGPDSVTGVLTEVHPHYIKLIADHETVIIFTHHIKSFTPPLRTVNSLKVRNKR